MMRQLDSIADGNNSLALLTQQKIKIESIGKVPDWHEAAGQDSWLFIDEIILR